MALRYQGTEPKVIVYNGNSNVEEVCIKNGANATPVYVWGKPFNCTCTVTVGSGAAGVDTTLSRLSSPYEGASEGNYVVTRKNGTSNTITVHKGDRVQISFMTDDTACEIVSANVYNKGKAVTTEIDAYMAYSDTFSVNGDVVCSVTTKKNETWHTVWTGNKLLASQSSTTLRGLPLPSGKLRIYIKVTPHYWEQAEGYAEEGSLPKEYKGYYSDDASRFYSWECYQIDGVAASASDTYDGSITVYMRKGAGADTQGSNISYDRIYMTKIECQGSW